jgi:hypothetical protein
MIKPLASNSIALSALSLHCLGSKDPALSALAGLVQKFK